MIADAVDTAITLGWALAAWIVLTAAVGTLALWTVVVTVWWTVRASVRAARPSCARLSARLRASTPLQALPEVRDAHRGSQGPSRPSPAWAQPDEDAA